MPIREARSLIVTFLEFKSSIIFFLMSAIFYSFILMVISRDEMVNPKNSMTCVGQKTDFLSLIVKPNFLSKWIVAQTLSSH